MISPLLALFSLVVPVAHAEALPDDVSYEELMEIMSRRFKVVPTCPTAIQYHFLSRSEKREVEKVCVEVEGGWVKKTLKEQCDAGAKGQSCSLEDFTVFLAKHFQSGEMGGNDIVPQQEFWFRELEGEGEPLFVGGGVPELPGRIFFARELGHLEQNVFEGSGPGLAVFDLPESMLDQPLEFVVSDQEEFGLWINVSLMHSLFSLSGVTGTRNHGVGVENLDLLTQSIPGEGG